MTVDGMTVRQVAEHLDVTPRTVRARVQRTQFPAPTRVVAGEPLWDPQEVNAFTNGTHPAFAEPCPDDRTPAGWWLAGVLDEVRWHVWEEGHARVPSAAQGRMTGPRASLLGPRVVKVRAHFRAGLVPPEVAAQFDALPGWVWNGRTAAWFDAFAEVAERWPHETTAQDRKWLVSQRANMPRLSADQRAAVESLPDVMERRGNRRVLIFVRAAKAWLGAHRGQDMGDMTHSAVVEVDGRVVPVGRKATYYRRRYAGKEGRLPLTPSEVRLIESLRGWDWSQSEHHVHAALARDRARAGRG